MYYVEKWGLGSWAAYHGDVRIGEPGSYGTREEAQEAVEHEYLADSAEGMALGAMSPEQRAAVIKRAARTFQAELQASAPAIAAALDEFEQEG
jgi:hypothetical protein